MSSKVLFHLLGLSNSRLSDSGYSTTSALYLPANFGERILTPEICQKINSSAYCNGYNGIKSIKRLPHYQGFGHIIKFNSEVKATAELFNNPLSFIPFIWDDELEPLKKILDSLQKEDIDFLNWTKNNEKMGLADALFFVSTFS